MTNTQLAIWEPIEAAPQDGTAILVTQQGTKRMALVYRVADDWRHLQGATPLWFKPTHFCVPRPL